MNKPRDHHSELAKLLQRAQVISQELLLEKKSLTGLLPKVDFEKLYKKKAIDLNTAINLIYLRRVTMPKPKDRDLVRSWAIETNWKISIMVSILSGNDMAKEMEMFFKAHYHKFKAYYSKKLSPIKPQKSLSAEG